MAAAAKFAQTRSLRTSAREPAARDDRRHKIKVHSTMSCSKRASDGDAPPPSFDEPNPQNGVDTPWKGISSLERLRSARNLSVGASSIISNSTSARRLSLQRDETKHTYIASLISDLQDALQELGATVACRQVETWAVFIHECTSSNNRVEGYHNIHRLFEITSGADPIQLVAAFFRDTINCSVDSGLSKKQAALVEGVVNDEYALVDDLESVEQGHPHILLTTHLFGVKPGQHLTDKKLDAFLSAIVTTQCLKDTLTPTQLAQILVCLEASIPFRGDDAMEALYHRLGQANRMHSLGLTQEELIQCIQRAADLSNRSHGNFSTHDASVFLDHTWSLLPEHNAALRLTYLYTVFDFQAAVNAMYEFLRNLNPSSIYVSFRGVPDEVEMMEFTAAATRNLDLGIIYVQAELLSVSTIAAFALLTGGDAPMSYFVGDLPRSIGSKCNNRVRMMNEYPSPPSLEHCNAQVYDILKSGRNCETNFDTRNSPLAAYLYACLGDARMETIVELLSFPFDDAVARQLLSRLPRESVELIGHNIATIAVSRAEQIEKVLQDLSSKNEFVTTS